MEGGARGRAHPQLSLLPGPLEQEDTNNYVYSGTSDNGHSEEWTTSLYGKGQLFFHVYIQNKTD